MAKKREFYFKSCDGVNRIHTVEWSPEDGVVRAVLHIVHGMASALSDTMILHVLWRIRGILLLAMTI